MRVVFTGYAILSAMVSLVLTSALMICDEYSDAFDRVVVLAINLMYISFGPALCTFCLSGLSDLPNIWHQCLPDGHISENYNTVDPIILIMATMLSFTVLCCFGIKLTSQMAEKDFNSEGSTFF